MERPIKLLIVDDEPEYVQVLIERLTVRGLDVTGSYSGAEALREVSGDLPDVVILDVAMPIKDGVDTLVDLKRIAPDLPVIMLSGHADMGTAIRVLELGAYNYLIKPISLDELVYNIEDAFDARL
jgi:DNA-binding NtrC family response regulator